MNSTAPISKQATPLRQLGASNLRVSAIGLGCWQFSKGGSLTASYWPTLDDNIIESIVETSLKNGVNWFDTAEAYGWGNSEESLAKALSKANKRKGDIIIANKWFPILRFASSIEKTIDKRLRFLKPFSIDLYQIHTPYGALASRASQLWAMKELVKKGKVRYLGVSNYNAKQMRKAHEELRRTPAPLISNQIIFNLLDRRIESNGVLDTARELGISLIAYSPLAQGLLSGKFHDNPDLINTRPGPRKRLKRFSRKGLADSLDIIHELRLIADKYKVTPSQVALRWVVQYHGDIIVAIPGATKVRHAKENADVLNFELTRQELDRLDTVSRKFRK